MSDLDIGWAVNDGDALDALDKIEKKGGKSATFLEKEFDQSANQLKKTFFGLGNIGQAAMLGIGGATAYGMKAMKEYAKISDDGADAIADFEAATTRMARNIGRDLAGVTRDLTGMMNGLEDWREASKDTLAGGLRWTGQALGLLDAADGGIDKVNEANRLSENQTAQVRAMTARMEMMRSLALQKARLQDDPVEAARLEGENLRMQTLKRLNELRMPPQDRAKVEDAMDDVIMRMQQQGALEMAKRSTDAEKLVQQMDRVQATEREQFDMSAQQLRIDNLRLEGQNKMADSLETQLEFAKRRRDIERSTLPPDEKRARIAELRSMEEFQLAHTREKLGPGSTRQIQSGVIGGAMLEALVFGGNKTKAQETLERIGYDQVKLLGRIAEAVESEKLVVV